MRFLPSLLAALCGAPFVAAQAPAWADLRPRLPAGLGDATCGVLVDLDGDGRAELVRAEGNRVRVLVQSAHGSFAERPAQPVLDFGAAGPVRALAVGRFDADADFDVVVGLGNGADEVLVNDGTGLLTRVLPSPIPPGPFPATEVVLAFDADGRAGDDLLVLAANAPPRLLFANPSPAGPAFFDATGFLPSTAAVPRAAAAAADIDLDGDVDLVFGAAALAPLLIVVNDGTGDFRQGTVGLGVVTPQARTLAVGDVTGDRFPDLVIGPVGTTALAPTVLRGGPGPRYTTVPPASFTALGFAALAVADFDRDGIAELALLQDDGQFVVAHGPGDGTFVRATTPGNLARRRALAVDDLDGDGDPDVWTAGLAIEDELWLAGPTPELVPTEDRTAPIGARRASGSVAVVDATGDLDPDLVLVGRDGGVALFRNDGSARFAEALAVPLPTLPAGGAYGAVRVARLTAGGVARDLVVLGQPTPTHPAGVRVLGWQPSGYGDVSAQVFPVGMAGRILTALRAAPLGAQAVETAVSDLVVGDSTGAVAVFRAVGGVYLELPGAVPAVASGAVLDVLVGDLDRDGAPDLVELASGGPPLVQLASGANGLAFRTLPGAIPIATPATAGAIVELNGDAIPDLLLATPGTASDLTLLFGRGDGTFVDLSSRWLTTLAPVGAVAALAPVGTTRIVVARDGLDDLVLVRQAASLVVEDVLPRRGSRASTGLAVADLDLDGDLDIVVARGDADPCVLAGTTRQLAAVGVGQPGQPLRLRLTGTGGTLGYLLLSPFVVRTPLPGFGVLRLLSPATLAAVPIVAGHGALDLVVPTGMPLFDLPLQLVTFDSGTVSIAIGNLERIAITDR